MAVYSALFLSQSRRRASGRCLIEKFSNFALNPSEIFRLIHPDDLGDKHLQEFIVFVLYPRFTLGIWDNITDFCNFASLEYIIEQ